MNNVSSLLYNDEARNSIIRGVNFLADSVKITLGPKGKNVAIFKNGGIPHLTKDGVTVANAINLKDPFENLGAQLVKEAAQRSAEVAGDGTTTSTVIAQKILNEGSRFLSSNMDPRQLVAGINAAADNVMRLLDETKIELTGYDDVLNVATVSANGDSHIGTLIADAIARVGEDGAISVEQARGFDTQLEVVDGTVIDRGFLSPYFVTNQVKSTVEFDNVKVLLYNQILSSPQSILPALEYAASNNNSLLIVANDVTSEALQTLVLNKMKGALRVCAIKAPEFGTARTVAFQDLSAVTGANVIAVDNESDIRETCVDSLGFCQKVIIDKNGTVLIGTAGDQKSIDERLGSARDTMTDPSSLDTDRAVAARRIKRLSSGIGVIRVGGSTEAEMLERKDRVDDALHAARAAARSGVQPGGGTALFYASNECPKHSIKDDSFKAGYDLLIRACKEPLRQIIENSGAIPEIVLEKINKKNKHKVGYDARNGVYGNMREFKILDSHLVVQSSLQHAVSVACSILLVGCAIAIEDEEFSDIGMLENV
jgi:chaperonin GroEL